MCSSRLRLTATVVLASFLIATTGCARERQRAASLNNAVTAAGQRIAAAGKAFGDAVVKAISSETPADVAAAKLQYTNLQSVVHAAKKEMADTDTSGVSGGAEFKGVVVKFFQNQETMVDTEFKEIVDILEKKNLSKEQREKEYSARMNKSAAKEAQDLAELRSAQQAFLARHNLPVPGSNGQTPVPGGG